MDSAADRVIDIYQRHAISWSRDRGERLHEKAWLNRFLALLPDEASVLDIGCGSGIPIAHYLIEHRCTVTGIDASSAMVALCANRFPEQQWRVADMRTLDLNRVFGGIAVWDSLFHLPQEDQRRMFAIFARHAAAGAPLLFTSGPSAGERVGSYRGEPLYHASLDADEYRELLHANDFHVVNHVVEDPAGGHRTVWLARRG
ncbi:class I SAM-dependent methyltransferase [Mycobacterium sp.]|uniref:class I SAM-dependent methyltransferase n=1 Tax=Mycobacterium sp. TaxID=1785 RepID=UPI0025D80821|nr:class I SAM-dependent methyltransferase [Mycobacterium sp.]MBW0013679.1 class I SAM-dependent methyltransferase [Mycobacterium sp.]